MALDADDVSYGKDTRNLCDSLVIRLGIITFDCEGNCK